MIEQVTLSNAAELDHYVLAHPNCHFMQTSYWGRVKTDWVWHGLIERQGSRIRGTMTLLEHRGRSIRLLYAPRGPIFEDLDAFRHLIEAARLLAQDERAGLLRIDPQIPADNRIFAAEAAALGFSLNCAQDYSLFQPRLCYVTDLQDLTPDTLQTIYHRSVRYHIRLAQRRGVTVRRGNAGDLDAFCAMMAETGAKNDFIPRPKEYFERFLSGMSDFAQLWMAELEGQPIAGALTVTCGSRMWLMYSCSEPSHLRDHPNELLQYHMQQFALSLGCRWYDFRGVEGYPDERNPKYGLHSYKQSFGAGFTEYLGQLDLSLRPLQTKLWKMWCHGKKNY